MQGFGHAVFKQVLEFVHTPGSALPKITGQVAQAFSGFLQALLGFGLALALEGQTIAEQGFHGFAALLLRFGHGTQARQPHLLCGWRKSLISGLRGGSFLGRGLGCGHGSFPECCRHFNLSKMQDESF